MIQGRVLVIPALENSRQEGFKVEDTKGDPIPNEMNELKPRQSFSASGLSHLDLPPRQREIILLLARAKYNSQRQEILLA